MAEVPSYGGFKVAPQGQTGFPISAPDMRGFGQGLHDLEQSSRQALAGGSQMAEIAAKAQDDANRLRVMEAENQAREAALHLTYDPADGYANIKGGDVLPRDGQPLAVQYAQKYRDQLNSIAEGLSNPEQRAMFAEQSIRLQGAFEAGAYEHEQREWQGYELSVAKGARELSTQTIAKNWINPAIIDGELANIDAAVATEGKRQGMSANEIVAAQADNRSAALTQAIAGALSNNDVTTASTLYDRYKDQLTATDDIRVHGTLQKEQDGQLVLQAADIAEGIRQPQMAAAAANASAAPKPLGETQLDPAIVSGLVKLGIPEHVARGVAAACFGESRSDPKAVNPASGALGIMQWLGPRKDELFKRYGPNPSKAQQIEFLAYELKGGDFGGKAVMGSANEVEALYNCVGKFARPKAGKQTNQDLQSGMTALGRKGAVGRPATLDDAWALARQYVLHNRPDASPQLLDDARREVESRWEMHKRSQDQADDQALKGVYTSLIGNGGSIAGLTAAQRAAIPPDRYDTVVNFADTIRRGGTQTDPLVYSDLVSHPDKLAGMSDSDFLALRPKLSTEDFTKLSAERGESRVMAEKGGVTNLKDSLTLNRETVNHFTNNRLTALGLPINPGPSDDNAGHVAAIRHFVDDTVLREQAARGRKLTDAETEQVIDRAFASSSMKSGWFSSYAAPTLDFTVDDIPSADRNSIKAAFHKAGNDAPTDADILAAWYAYRRRQK